MLKKIWNGLSTVLMIVIVLLALLLAGAHLLGLQVYTVLSGSMEPNYHVGSIIYVKEVDPATLQVGDTISFLLNKNTVATHRIIEVIPDAENPNVIRFRTKGDNNKIEDTNPVPCSNVLGKVVGTIPLLGYISEFVQKPPGIYITIVFIAALVLAVFLPDLTEKGKERKTESEFEQITADNERIKVELEQLKENIAQEQMKVRQTYEKDV